MTQRDKRIKRDCVTRYWEFKDECISKNMKFEAGDSVCFILPMPESWSCKKKIIHNQTPHLQTPDLDNLLKGLMDALYKNDSAIWSFQAKKLWGYEGKMIIQNG